MTHTEAVDAFVDAFQGKVVHWGPYYRLKRRKREMTNLKDATRFNPVEDLPSLDLEGKVTKIIMPEVGGDADILAWVLVRQPHSEEVYEIAISRWDERSAGQLELAKETGRRVHVYGYLTLNRYVEAGGRHRCVPRIQAQMVHVADKLGG